MQLNTVAGVECGWIKIIVYKSCKGQKILEDFYFSRKKYSKSLSWAENLNLTANNLFKFSAQDNNLEYLFWGSKNLPQSSDIIPTIFRPAWSCNFKKRMKLMKQTVYIPHHFCPFYKCKAWTIWDIWCLRFSESKHRRVIWQASMLLKKSKVQVFWEGHKKLMQSSSRFWVVN